jgi:hypothetical protein
MLKGILLINVFPGLLALVATFLMISQIGDVIPAIGLNTHTSLILVYLGGAMGVNIWLMKGFLDTVPRDIDESAMVEGASNWQIFSMLILPLLRPILIVRDPYITTCCAGKRRPAAVRRRAFGQVGRVRGRALISALRRDHLLCAADQIVGA